MLAVSHGADTRGSVDSMLHVCCDISRRELNVEHSQMEGVGVFVCWTVSNNVVRFITLTHSKDQRHECLGHNDKINNGYALQQKYGTGREIL